MLWERQPVRIQVLPEESGDVTDQVIQSLVAAGVLTPPPGHSNRHCPNCLGRSAECLGPPSA